ncbi:MAG: Cys-tRNA(Pro) deacylase [Anaeroplasma sp.]
MRILDQKKIKYEIFEYPHKEGVCIDGENVAKMIGENPNMVFKTLVTESNDKHYYICVIPVNSELNLKKAAKYFNVKSLAMIAVKDLLNVTGYIRGGCSPIGMKKVYPTIVDNSALSFEKIIFSGGKIGCQIKMNPKDLDRVIKVSFADIKE